MEFTVYIAVNNETNKELPIIPAIELHDYLNIKESEADWMQALIKSHNLVAGVGYGTNDGKNYILAVDAALNIVRKDYPDNATELLTYFSEELGVNLLKHLDCGGEISIKEGIKNGA